VKEPVVTVHLREDWARRSLVDDVRLGLGATPRSLPPKWLYDERGSKLFDEITRLPEYYPTEREREILRRRAPDVARVTGAATLVELGSGTSDKTRVLIDALTSAGTLQHFVPIDVSESTVREAALALAMTYPQLQVEALVCDFADIPGLPGDAPRLVAFLGGTIGNLDRTERAAFLGGLAARLQPGDWLLLGTDLVKEIDRLVAAYDDPGGVTAEFVSNSLRVVNRELGGDFDLDRFTYVAFWDPTEERMDLRMRSDIEQQVRIPGAEITVDLARGEEIHIEISSKFRLPGVAAELADAGFSVAEHYTDPSGDYALTLARVEP
jgi:L-histidine Nalpha-methyltransferase